MSLIKSLLQQKAQNLKIHPVGKEPIVAPAIYKSFMSFPDLQNSGLLSSIIQCYQEVFGDEEQWGEGYFCMREGWKKKISFQEYNRRLEEKGISHCDCGEGWQLCHSPHAILQKIKEDMESPLSACTLMMDGDQVVGFAWGKVQSFKQACEKIKSDHNQLPAIGEALSSALRRYYFSHNLADNDLVFWASELGILQHARNGLPAIIFLTRNFLLNSYQFCQGRILFFTSLNSRLSQILVNLGSHKIAQSDHYILMFEENIEIFLRVLQNCDPETVKEIMQACRNSFGSVFA